MNTYLIYAPAGQPSYPALLAGATVICALGYYIYWLSQRPAAIRGRAPKCDVCNGTGREPNGLLPDPLYSKTCPACNGTGLKQSPKCDVEGWQPLPPKTDAMKIPVFKTGISTLTTGQPVPTTQVRSGTRPASRITIQPPGAIPPPPARDKDWPRLCELCNNDMESPDDRVEWHGIGSCVPICMPCAGSGKQLPKHEIDADGWPRMSFAAIAVLPDSTPHCPACDGRGYDLPSTQLTEVRSATIHGVVAPGTLRITKIQSPELNELLEQTSYEHERDIVIRAYRLGRAQATTPLPIASVPSQFPAGTPTRPRAQLSSVEKLLTFISCCDVCGAEAANLELNVQCDTCLGRTVTKLVDEWKNDIRGQIQATPIFKCDICRSTTTANHCDVVCHRDECIQHFVAMNTAKDVQ